MLRRQQELKTKLNNFLETLKLKAARPLNLCIKQLSEQLKSRDTIQGASRHLKQIVEEKASKETIAKYMNLKQKKSYNQCIINIVQRGQHISRSLQALVKYQDQNIQQINSRFVDIVEAFQNFEQLAQSINHQVPFNTIRQQLYLLSLVKIEKATETIEQVILRFKQVMLKYNLPLKKDEVRKQGMKEQDREFFIYQIYRQYCFTMVRKYLQGMLEKQSIYKEDILLKLYWEQSVKSAIYLFVNYHELRNIQQPAWMFEYLQLVLTANFKYLVDFLIPKDIRDDFSGCITKYYIQASYESLFLHAITQRFEEDHPSLNEFLIFNFLDELGKLEDKLNLSFSLRSNLVEGLLLKFQDSHQILNKALEYEQKWFQTKIIQDFTNINYSKINLKNLQAFNILSNFFTLFERLRNKYKNIQDELLRKKISKFYQMHVLNLVAHIKTCFDRIYNYSKLPKIEILLSFKRIESEVSTSLKEFIEKQNELEEALQKDYYHFLQQYFQVCALEAMTPTHKKLHISLADIMGCLGAQQQYEHEKYINAFNKIFIQWEQKVVQIVKFAPYIDLKVRSIFFKYLEAITFSSVGLNLFLKIFEPYLRLIFPQDRHRVLISMITMKKKEFSEYIQSHGELILFLTAQQRRQLQIFKRTEEIY